MEKPKYTFTSGCFAVSDDGAWRVARSPLRLALRRWGVRRKMLCVLKWIALTLIFPVVAFLLLYILIFETEEN